MVYIDYLTLTSYSHSAQAKIPYIIQKALPGKWKRSKVMQYNGWRNDEFFYGFAEQNKRRHLMLRSSGRWSASMLNAIPQHYLQQMNCTRIDLQVTVKLPDGWNEDNIFEQVNEGVGKTKIVNDTEKTWTVYIGSRRSKIFWRVYIKHYEQKYLRYEVELKRSVAHQVYSAIARYGQIALTPIFKTRLQKLKVSDAAREPALEHILGIKSHDYQIDMDDEMKEKSIEKMCQWLDNLTSCFEKRLQDHEVGHIMRNYINEWASIPESIDSHMGESGID